MLTPNGGVFGRNPKFNNVTVEGNLTVNGDIALGDDITVTDTLTVNGITTVANTTESTASTNGSLVVAGGVGIAKRLNVAGAVAASAGLTSVPSASVPTTNLAIGSSAGVSMNSSAAGAVTIGLRSGDAMTASDCDIAIGQDALGSLATGALTLTNTTPGTGGTPGTYTAVQLEKDSGTGTMAVYPQVTIVVGAGGDVTFVSVTSSGSGATVQSGIVLRPVSGSAAGIPSNWRATLATVVGRNVAIGLNALVFNTAANNVAVGGLAGQNNTTGPSCTFVGYAAGLSNTTGFSNSCFGTNAGVLLSTGGANTLLGTTCGQFVGTGNSNSAVGSAALGNGSNGSSNVAVGAEALNQGGGLSQNTACGQLALGSQNTGNDNAALGWRAGQRVTAGTTATSNTNSVFVGSDARPNANAETNQIVIGQAARGDGSNTTVINNTSCTSTRFAGTATSVLRTSGDTLRIDNARTPATAGAAGNAGDICWDANYIYVCVAANTWKRAAIATWP